VTVRLALSLLVAALLGLRVGQRVLARRQAAAALAAGGHLCPSCGARRLVVTEALALPGDAESDAVDLEALACRRCDLRAVGVRRGPEDHRGFAVEPVAWGRLSAALRRCPAPRDRACACPEHARYGRQEGGAWRGMDAVPHDASAAFPVG
jgi:hypothetical protein